jgi:hypothetical protein
MAGELFLRIGWNISGTHSCTHTSRALKVSTCWQSPAALLATACPHMKNEQPRCVDGTVPCSRMRRRYRSMQSDEESLPLATQCHKRPCVIANVRCFEDTPGYGLYHWKDTGTMQTHSHCMIDRAYSTLRTLSSTPHLFTQLRARLP